jgi:hypothetical protein
MLASCWGLDESRIGSVKGGEVLCVVLGSSTPVVWSQTGLNPLGSAPAVMSHW